MAKNRRNQSGFSLYPFQLRWVEDDSRYKIACKARQIGFSFAATFRVVRRRRRIPGLTVWLSASVRQALEAMEYVRHHLRVEGLVARFQDGYIEGTEIRQQQIRLPNGSRIVALPANPDTVRGFAGDIVLDEFAFHRDAEAIWRAAFATATRGYQIEIISTPNGARGKYYELARAAGLVNYNPGAVGAGLVPARTVSPMHVARSTMHEVWSPHWVSLAHARAEGFVVDVESLRAAISDEDAWQQEYCCRFLTQAAHFIPPEMVVAAEHPAATTSLPLLAISGASASLSAPQPSAVREGLALAMPRRVAPEAHPWKSERSGDPAFLAGGSGENQSGFPRVFPTNPCYLGVDVGRRRDLTVLWLLEVENPAAPADARRYLTRAVLTLERRPFAEQRRAIDSLLALRASAAALAGHGGTCPERSRGSRAENTAPLGVTAEGVRACPERSRGGNPAWVSPAGISLLVLRCAIDASGLGLMLAEELHARWGARVEPVTFTSAVKEDLAVRVKRLLEERRLLLPYDPVIRASLAAVKRYFSPTGNIRFDADRTEAGHADHFWALALALAAADDSAPTTEFISTHSARAFAQTALF